MTHRRGRPSFTLALLGSAAMLLVAGCGSGSAPPPEDGAAAGSPSGSFASEEPARDAAAITAIDAAQGDGRAMPEDSHGPSAYDLALAADRRDQARDARKEETDDGAPAAGTVAPPAAGDAAGSGDVPANGG